MGIIDAESYLEAMSHAKMDAMIYGIGFLAMNSRGQLRYISPLEVREVVDNIEKNSVNTKGDNDGTD